MRNTLIAIICLSAAVLLLAFFFRSRTNTSQQLFIGPVTVECTGSNPQRCLQVKYHPDEEYQLFYDQIQGFEFIPGYNYLIEVLSQTDDNPPADASSIQYQLVQILEQQEAQYIAITEPTDFQVIDTSQPITISGTGRGLFEGNVVIQIEDRDTNQIVLEEFTTMTTPNPGDLGNWNTTISLPVNQDINAGLRAFSPSPKDASENISYSLPITLSSSSSTPDLDSTSWLLNSYQDSTTNQQVTTQPNTSITAEFLDGQISGSAGCNNYFGPYTAANNQIAINQLATTLKACPEPIMSQEQQYLTLLQISSSYQVTETTLTMFDPTGNTTLVFQSQQPISLESTPWQAQGINNGRGGVVTSATTPLSTALFQNNQITGNAGCNDYQGSYQADDGSITIGPLATTRRACDPELMQQEQEFLTALQNANRYQIDQDRLNLRQDQSTMVNFISANQ